MPDLAYQNLLVMQEREPAHARPAQLARSPAPGPALVSSAQSTRTPLLLLPAARLAHRTNGLHLAPVLAPRAVQDRIQAHFRFSTTAWGHATATLIWASAPPPAAMLLRSQSWAQSPCMPRRTAMLCRLASRYGLSGPQAYISW